MELSVDADTIRVRLLDRALLYDRPDCFEAGVLEALSAMAAITAEPFRAGRDDRDAAGTGTTNATAGAVTHS